MYYGKINNIDVANGEGVRVTLFVSGCRNCCKGCFQPQTWNFFYGEEFGEKQENEILNALSPEFISGLTVLGGEPFEEENQLVLTPFLKKVKEAYPHKTIWCYTGYILEQDLLSEKGKKHTEVTEEMLSYIDVLVDGPFIEEKRNLMLEFRGSDNQRIIRNLKEILQNRH